MKRGVERWLRHRHQFLHYLRKHPSELMCYHIENVRTVQKYTAWNIARIIRALGTFWLAQWPPVISASKSSAVWSSHFSCLLLGSELIFTIFKNHHKTLSPWCWRVLSFPHPGVGLLPPVHGLWVPKLIKLVILPLAPMDAMNCGGREFMITIMNPSEWRYVTFNVNVIFRGTIPLRFLRGVRIWRHDIL